MEAWPIERSAAIFVDVEPVRVARRLAVDSHAERDGRASLRRGHDEIDVAGVEAEREAPAGLVQHARPRAERPVS